ncbi:MAG TPA: hypothetical protein VFC09_04955 [Candidatus Dormibacteraeota bacterium]|nr:hypothetical protein [Candidatus Dormibacteraeota bacterium]
MSALAYALSEETVWLGQRRSELRKAVREGGPASRMGFVLHEFLKEAEAVALEEGAVILRETHLAEAFHRHHHQQLLEIGVQSGALTETVRQREMPPTPSATPKRPTRVGAARQVIFDDFEQEELEQVINSNERSARVERKRTIALLNDDPGLADLEKFAVGLVNTNPQRLSFLIFGQNDDLSLWGDRGFDGRPLTDAQIAKYEDRLTTRLTKCMPAVLMQWRTVEREGRILRVACLIGRELGTPVYTSLGSYPFRSGEHTYFASPERIVAWVRERDASAYAESPGQDEPSTATDQSRTDDDTRVRQAIQTLDTAIDGFFAAPPTIPQSINGRAVDDWRPVYEPIVEPFCEAIETLTQVGGTISDSALSRLVRRLRSVFDVRSGPSRSGLSWITEAPRLITRLIADRLLVRAYCTSDWERMEIVGMPMFDSYVGRVPWIVSPEYRHLETLGGHGETTIALSLHLMQPYWTDHLKGLGVPHAQMLRALASITVGEALALIARDDKPYRPPYAWGLGRPEFWQELCEWDEEPGIITTFARWSGEPDNSFRGALRERLTALINAEQSAGRLLLVTAESWKLIDRIAQPR